MPPDVARGPDVRVPRGIRTASLALLVLVAGCAQPAAMRRDARPTLTVTQGADGLPDWHRSERLYLSPAGCRRIYVQVDCVAGACPTEAETDALEAFLHRHCRPDEGIIFDRGPTIARHSVGRRDEVQLALGRMRMPQAYDDGRTGYVYILFYDSRLTGGQPQRPYVRVDYPSAIFVDMAYWTDRNRRVLPTALQHEMGHVLGLTKNDDHGDGSHCNNPRCIMHPTIKIPRPGRGPIQRSLCVDCRTDLARSRNSLPAGELSFRGPVLVRRGAGYRVASLPGYTRILLDSPQGQDYAAVADKARAYAATSSGLADKCHCSFDVDRVVLKDRGALRRILAALARARRDPDATVAGLAEQLTRRLQASLETPVGAR